MASLKLVIFDCDGVMFDSLAANLHYYNQILAQFGHPPMDREELDYVHVHHVLDSIRHIFRHHPADYQAALAYREGLDYTPFLRYMTMEPDLLEFLEFLRPRYKTAISTNRADTMAKVLDLFHLRDYFEKVVTVLDVRQPKPHPEALFQILDHFACRVEEAIYIGDSMVDREHTAAVGMRLIAFKNPTLPAEFRVESFMAITQLPIF